MENINQVYHSKLKASREELYEACQGLVTDHNIYLLQMIRQDIFDKEVIIAIGHSILKSVYHVICEEKAYRELGAFLCQ